MHACSKRMLRRCGAGCAEEEGREGGAEWEISVGESGSEVPAGVARLEQDASQGAQQEADLEVGERPPRSSRVSKHTI